MKAKLTNPVWPLLAAPLVAGVYYLALKAAFTRSIETAVGTIATSKIELGDLAAPQWGSHWIYRIVAEVVAVGFATFVSAGLARGRERAAAITGGVTIALGFFARIVLLLFALAHLNPDDYAVPEPWYQYVIEGFMVIACPIIGFHVAETARDINDSQPTGFAGINRLHFLWLWFAAFWYALGLISPIVRFYALQFASGEWFNPITGLITIVALLIVGVVPAAALLIPGYFGLALLSRHQGIGLHPIARNLLGIAVLAVGFVIGVGIQIGWQGIFRWLFG